MPTFALSMAPLDWGLCGAAILLAVFAARTFVTGEGKAQMGLGFMLVSAVVGTFAIGRQIEGFNAADGARLSIGVLLLVPVFRVLFTHTGSSVTTAVVSLLLSSVIAGPVVARAFPEHVETDVPYEITKVQTELDRVTQQIDETRATRDSIVSSAASARAAFDAMGIGSAAELEKSEAGLEAWTKYKGLRESMDDLQVEIDALVRQRDNLEASLAALEDGADHRGALSRADAIRKEVEESIATRDLKSDAERYVDRSELIEFFETEIATTK